MRSKDADNNTREEKRYDRLTIASCRDEIIRLRDELQQQTLHIQRLSPGTYQKMQSTTCDSRVPSLSNIKSIRTVRSAAASYSSQNPEDSTTTHSTDLDPPMEQADLSTRDFYTHRDSLSDWPARTELDRLLLAQRPYRAAARRGSYSSFDSTATGTNNIAWSWVSTFSISEISNISLLELPLIAAKLYDPKQWGVEETTTNMSESTHEEELPINSSDIGLLALVRHLQGAAYGQEKIFLATIQRSRVARCRCSVWILSRTHHLTMTYLRTGTFDAAEDLVKHVIDGCIKQGVSSKHWNCFTEAQDIQTDKTISELRAEEQMLSIGFDRCREFFGEDPSVTLHAAFNLGQTYRQQKNYGQAEKAFLYVLNWPEICQAKYQRLAFYTSKNLADVYVRLSRHREAEHLLHRLLDEHAMSQDCVFIASVYFLLARFHRSRRRYDKAENVLLRGIHHLNRIDERSRGFDDLGTLETPSLPPGERLGMCFLVNHGLETVKHLNLLYDALRMLGQVYRLQDKSSKKAEWLFLWILQNSNKETSRIDRVYFELGCIWNAKHETNKAQGMFRQSIQFTKDTKESDPYIVFGAYVGLVDCLLQENKIEEAGKLYDEAVDIVGRISAGSFSSKNNDGNGTTFVDKQLRTLEEAEIVFLCARAMCAENLRWQSPQVSCIVRHLTDIYEKQGKCREAKECYHVYSTGPATPCVRVSEARPTKRIHSRTPFNGSSTPEAQSTGITIATNF